MKRRYKDELTVDVNEKGVLDLDTVKGCSLGIKDNPGGCWGVCYAKKVADFRGLNFAVSVQRRIKGLTHARQLAKVILSYPFEFVRIGTMGDPSHAWLHTLTICKWLRGCHKIPVIVTKHWVVAPDSILEGFGKLGVIFNTSISALDTDEHLKYRLEQYERYKKYGKSILRIVSCDFNRENEEGKRRAEIQDNLFKYDKALDNPLRCPKEFDWVKRGVIRVSKEKDLNSEVYMSKWNKSTHTGDCENCNERCGVNM